MVDIKFAAPPAGRTSEVGLLLDALRQDGSGQWAEYQGTGSPTQAKGINDGDGYGVQFVGEFEAACRVVDGESKLFVRYMPEAVADPAKQEALKAKQAEKAAKAKEAAARKKAEKAAADAQGTVEGAIAEGEAAPEGQDAAGEPEAAPEAPAEADKPKARTRR